MTKGISETRVPAPAPEKFSNVAQGRCVASAAWVLCALTVGGKQRCPVGESLIRIKNAIAYTKRRLSVESQSVQPTVAVVAARTRFVAAPVATVIVVGVAAVIAIGLLIATKIPVATVVRH